MSADLDVDQLTRQARSVDGPLLLAFEFTGPLVPERQAQFHREFLSRPLHWDELELDPTGNGWVWFAAPLPEFADQAAEERANVVQWLAEHAGIKEVRVSRGEGSAPAG